MEKCLVRRMATLMATAAAVALAPSASHAVTFFTEDFSDENLLPMPFLTQSPGTDADFIAFGDVAWFPGFDVTDRSYLRTSDSDYNFQSFVAEITVNLGGGGDAGTAFFGLGEGEPDGFNSEPRLGAHAFMRIFPSDFNGGEVTIVDDGLEGMPAGGAGGDGTHRLQIRYSQTSGLMQFGIQQAYGGGAFSASTLFDPIIVDNNGFDGTNARIFFGGSSGTGSGVFFDDLSVADLTGSSISWGGGSGSDWSMPGNWAGGAVPGLGDSVEFVAAANTDVELGGNRTVNDVQFSGSDSYTLDPIAGPGMNTLKLESGHISVGAGGSHTINSNIEMLQPTPWSLDGDLTVAGSLSSQFDLNKGGFGELKLTGNNSGFTQNISLDGGSLVLDGNLSGNDTVADTSTINMQPMTMLSINSAEEIGGLDNFGAAVILNANLTVGAINQNINLAGDTSGTGQLILTGNGDVLLTADANHTGLTTVGPGRTLKVGNGGTAGSISGDIALMGQLEFNRTDASTYAGMISGNGDVTKNGAGNLTLTEASTFMGPVQIEAGKIVLNNNNALQNALVTINTPNGLDITSNGVDATIAGIQGNQPLNIGAQTLTIGNTGVGSNYSGVISGTGSISKIGGGSLFLNADNSFTGGVNVLDGTLGLLHNNAAGTGSISMGNSGNPSANPILSYGNGVVVPNGVVLNDDATFEIFSGTATQSGPITNSFDAVTGDGVDRAAVPEFAITKTGAGTLTLSGSNTYTGGTTITAGTLLLTNSNAAGSGGVTISGATLGYGNGVNIARTINLQANSTLEVTTGIATQSGPIGETGGSFGYTKTGAGALVLTKSSTYTGGTTLNGGTLSLGHSGVLGSGALTIQGSTVDYADTVSISNAIVLENNATLNVDTGVATQSGVISQSDGVYGITKTGAGTITLTGNNTYGGGTILNGGTLSLGHNNALGTGNLTIQGSTVDYADGIDMMNAIVLEHDATLNVDTGSATQSGAISESGGSFGFTKTGAGTLAIGGNNTYTGVTHIDGGQLQITTLSLNNSVVSINTTNGLTGLSNTQIFLGGLTGNSDQDFSNASLFIGAGTDLAYGGTFGGSANVTKNGTAKLTLTSTGSTMNSLNVNNGLMEIGGGGDLTLGSTFEALRLASNGDLEVKGGTLNLNTTNSTATVANGRTLSVFGGGGQLNGNDLALGEAVATLVAEGAEALGPDTTPGHLVVSDIANVTLSGTATLLGESTITVDEALLDIGGLQSADTTTQVAIKSPSPGTAALAVGANNISSSFAGTIADASGGPGRLAKTGAGTFTLTNANSFTGGVQVSGGGTLVLGHSSAAGTGAIDVDNAVLEYLPGITVNNPVILGSTGTLNIASFVATQAGVISNQVMSGGRLVKFGAGQLTLSGVNTYTGGTEIHQGSLGISNDGNLGNPSGSVALVGGGLQILSDHTTARNFNVVSSGEISIQSTSYTITGAVNGFGGIDDTLNIGEGTLILSGPVNIGRVTPVNSNADLIFDGATGTLTGSADVLSTNQNSITFKGGADITINNPSGVIGADSLLRITDSQTLLKGNPTVFLGDNSEVVVENGAVFTATAPFTVGDRGTFTVQTSAQILSTDVHLGVDGTFGFDAATALVTGFGSRWESDNFTLGESNVSGEVTVDGEAVFQVNNQTTIQTSDSSLIIDRGEFLTGSLVISGGAMPTIQITDPTVDTLVAGGAALVVSDSRVAMVIGTDDTDSTIPVPIADAPSGPGTLKKMGAGTLTLAAANTHTGGTKAAGGTIAVSSDSNLGGATAPFKFDSGTLQALASFSTNVNRPVNIHASGGTIDTNSFDLTVNGVIDDVGDLTKTGTGTLTLTNANVYSGNTIITNGRLLANNTTGSATGTGTVTVQSGATLSGSGTISGPVVIESGGMLLPGDDIGPMFFDSDLTLDPNSFFAAEIAGVNPDNDFDSVNVAGTTTLGGTLIVSLENGFTPSSEALFVVVASPSISGVFDSAILPEPDWGVGYFRDAGAVAVGQTQNINWVAPAPNGFAEEDWGVAANWDLNRTPLPLDNVFINNDGARANISGAQSVFALNVNLGTAGGEGRLNVHGDSSLSIGNDMNIGTDEGTGSFRNSTAGGDAPTVIGNGLNIGTGGGNGFGDFFGMVSVGGNMTVGATGGKGDFQTANRPVTIGGDLNIGVDGGTGTGRILFGTTTVSVGSDINIGTTRSGIGTSDGNLNLANGSVDGLGTGRIAVGLSSSGGTGMGVLEINHNPAAGDEIRNFTTVDVGRVEDSGNADGLIWFHSDSAFANVPDLNVGFNDGSGTATGTLQVDGATVTGLQNLNIGTSTPGSTGNTVATAILNGGLINAQALNLNTPNGAGLVEASIQIPLFGAVRGGTPDAGGYGAINADSAVLDGIIEATFQYVPTAGLWEFELINTTSSNGITGTPALITNANQGFNTTFATVLDNGVAKVLLTLDGAPVTPSWINTGTGPGAESWYDASNWSSPLIPGAGDPTVVNNGGESVVSSTFSGGIAATAFSLDVGTDGNSGAVTVSVETLDILRDLRVGSIGGGASGTSVGTVSLANATLNAGDPINLTTVGRVEGATAESDVTAKLEAINSTINLTETLHLGTAENNTAAVNIDATLILNNSTLNAPGFEGLNTSSVNINPAPLTAELTTGNTTTNDVTKSITVSITNGSAVNVGQLSLEGAEEPEAGATSNVTVDIDITNSSTDSLGDTKLISNRALTDGSTANLIGTLDIADSTITTQEFARLSIFSGVGTSGVGTTTEGTLAMNVTRSALTAGDGISMVNGSASGAGAMTTTFVTANIQDNSSLTSDRSFNLANHSAGNNGVLDSEVTVTLSNSTLDFGESFAFGQQFVTNGGTAMSTASLQATDSALTIGENMFMAGNFHDNGGIVQATTTLGLTRSTLSVAGNATIGDLASADFQAGQDFVLANLNLTDSVFTVGVDLITAIDQAQTTITLNPSYLSVGGSAVFGDGNTIDFTLEGTTRADATNVNTGLTDLYSAVDVTDPVSLGGTLEVSVDTNNFDPAYGDTFTLLTSASLIGSFSNFEGVVINPDGTKSLAVVFANLNDSDDIPDAVVAVAAIPGDTNLDGMVSIGDLSLLASNFGEAPGLGSWRKGDFNHDGQITIGDLSLLASNFGQTNATIGNALNTGGLSIEAVASLADIDLSTIPEPNTLLAFATVMPLLISRRRAR